MPREEKSARRPSLFAGADRDHPRRLRVRVVRVFARAVVAGGEDADDAVLVGLVRGDVDRVGVIERRRSLPQELLITRIGLRRRLFLLVMA